LDDVIGAHLDGYPAMFSYLDIAFTFIVCIYRKTQVP
jgi:hypothetical protein